MAKSFPRERWKIIIVKISFLVPDIACPVLGPVTELARMMQMRHEVDIVGPDFGHGICPMYREAFSYKVIEASLLYRFPDFFRESRKMMNALEGDVIVAVKAFAQTIWPAYRLKCSQKRKMVVYLDEWDGYLYERLSLQEKIMRWRSHWMHPVDDVYCPWMERLIPHADMVISSSSYLQKKFGGHVVPVGANTQMFQPLPASASLALRRSLALENKKVIVFGGVVRPHKGIEVLLDALSILGRNDLCLLIVGPETEHVKDIQSNTRYASLVQCTGSRPKQDMPKYLGLADIVVLPQVDNELAQSQVPCKIFEAMAAGKPIIASAVSDLPDILNGCGWICPPADASALASIISQALSQPEESLLRGAAARNKCLRLYSHEAVAVQWCDRMDELVHQ